MDFVTAFNWLSEHPIWGPEGCPHHLSGFRSCLSIYAVYVDPSTDEIDVLDESKNTKTAVWLEAGAPKFIASAPGDAKGWYPCHDIDLDCGANMFEDAIIKLASLVEIKYGGY